LTGVLLRAKIAFTNWKQAAFYDKKFPKLNPSFFLLTGYLFQGCFSSLFDKGL
jgi:hypothetical protein